MSFLRIPSRFSACINGLFFVIVSCCFWAVSLLVNLIVANVSPSVFHLFLHVVTVPPHSRLLSV